MEEGEQGRRRVGSQAILAAAVFLLAVALRLPGIDQGLPYLHHWDEPTVVARALEIARSGNLDPGYFNYPSLAFYLDAAALRLGEATGALDFDLDEVEVGAPGGDPWFVSHAEVYRLVRLVHVLASALAAVLALALAFQLSGSRWCAAVAGLIVACLPLHVELSRWVAVDGPATTLALAAMVLAIRWESRRALALLVGSGGLAGLAASTKYNLGLVGLILLGWLVMRSPEDRWWTTWRFSLALALGFVIATPYALLTPVEFLDGTLFELRHYVVEGHDSRIVPAVGGVLGHLAQNLGVAVGQLGWVGAGLALLGSVWAAGRSAGALVVSVFALQVLLTSLTRVHFPRNVLLAAVLGTVLAALGCWAVAEWGRRLAGGRWQRIGVWTAALATAGLLLSVVPAGLDWSAGMARRSLDSRTVAARDVAAGWCGEGVSLRVDRHLELHPRDLEALDSCDLTSADPFEIHCFPARSDLSLVGARYHTPLPGRADEAAALTKLAAAVPDHTVLAAWGTGATRVTHYSVNPRARLLAAHETPTSGVLECASVAMRTPLTLSDSPDHDGVDRSPAGEDDADASGWVSAPVWHPGGSLHLRWADRAAEPGVELEVVVEVRGPDGRDLLVARRPLDRAVPYQLKQFAMKRQADFGSAPAGFVSVRFVVSGETRADAAVWRPVLFHGAGGGGG